MLKILNDLNPFFNDVFKEIGVREYAREAGISPPTASKMLNFYESENILKKREFKKNLLFRSDKDHDLFENLAKIYWKELLRKELVQLNKEVLYSKIILFGSIVKSENTADSDIDLFVETGRKKVNVKNIEKRLKRKIELHFKEELSNKHLKKNIEKGIWISGIA